MNSCLDAGGHSVGFLSHGLMRATLSQVWRPYVMSGQLVLVSAVVPEQGLRSGLLWSGIITFTLSDAAIVAASDEKGGTWAGAQANHKAGFPCMSMRRVMFREVTVVSLMMGWVCR